MRPRWLGERSATNRKGTICPNPLEVLAGAAHHGKHEYQSHEEVADGGEPHYGTDGKGKRGRHRGCQQESEHVDEEGWHLRTQAYGGTVGREEELGVRGGEGWLMGEGDGHAP